jgi:hypothetical protein
LLRARLCDAYGLAQLAQELPAMAWRVAVRGTQSSNGKTPQAV